MRINPNKLTKQSSSCWPSTFKLVYTGVLCDFTFGSLELYLRWCLFPIFLSVDKIISKFHPYHRFRTVWFYTRTVELFSCWNLRYYLLKNQLSHTTDFNRWSCGIKRNWPKSMVFVYFYFFCFAMNKKFGIC